MCIRDRAYTDALAALQGTNAVRIAELSATLDELFKLRAGGLFGPEVEEAIGNLRDQLEGLKQPLADVNTFALEAGKNIQNALGDSILASLEGSTKNIGRIWGDMLKRMAAQAAGAQLGRWLLGFRSGSADVATAARDGRPAGACPVSAVRASFDERKAEGFLSSLLGGPSTPGSGSLDPRSAYFSTPGSLDPGVPRPPVKASQSGRKAHLVVARWPPPLPLAATCKTPSRTSCLSACRTLSRCTPHSAASVP